MAVQSVVAIFGTTPQAHQTVIQMHQEITVFLTVLDHAVRQWLKWLDFVLKKQLIVARQQTIKVALVGQRRMAFKTIDGLLKIDVAAMRTGGLDGHWAISLYLRRNRQYGFIITQLIVDCCKSTTLMLRVNGL
jgi:hypothetical protein